MLAGTSLNGSEHVGPVHHRMRERRCKVEHCIASLDSCQRPEHIGATITKVENQCSRCWLTAGIAAYELRDKQVHASGPSGDERHAVLPQQRRRQPPGPTLFVVSGARHIVEGPRLTRQYASCCGRRP